MIKIFTTQMGISSGRITSKLPQWSRKTAKVPPLQLKVYVVLTVIETVNDSIRSEFVGDTKDVEAGDRWACVLISLTLGVNEVRRRVGGRRAVNIGGTLAGAESDGKLGSCTDYLSFTLGREMITDIRKDNLQWQHQ
jgi:hypothetical protein